MKYLKLYESFNEIDAICKKYGIKNYTINSDGSIDVDGNVNLNNKGLKKLPLKFGKVTGTFYCSNNQLTSLEGSPQYVGGSFYCSFNRLTSLQGCPESVGDRFDCSHNQLTSLVGSPRSVSGYFNCCNNQLRSLEHFPQVGGDIYLYDNPVDNIWQLFKDKDKIELLNDYDVIRGNSIIIDRLNEFLQEIGKPPVKSVEGYNNI